MSERFWVRLQTDQLVFAAAHFITYGDQQCERLHGHNYHVHVWLAGPLNEQAYVVDFLLLNEILQEILDSIDHRMLIPLNHPTIRVTADEHEVRLEFEERRWIFPRCDCVLLPLANTTAELMARYVGSQLLQKLSERDVPPPEGLRIEVGEDGGQWGGWEHQAEAR